MKDDGSHSITIMKENLKNMDIHTPVITEDQQASPSQNTSFFPKKIATQNISKISSESVIKETQLKDMDTVVTGSAAQTMIKYEKKAIEINEVLHSIVSSKPSLYLNIQIFYEVFYSLYQFYYDNENEFQLTEDILSVYIIILIFLFIGNLIVVGLQVKKKKVNEIVQLILAMVAFGVENEKSTFLKLDDKVIPMNLQMNGIATGIQVINILYLMKTWLTKLIIFLFIFVYPILRTTHTKFAFQMPLSSLILNIFSLFFLGFIFFWQQHKIFNFLKYLSSKLVSQRLLKQTLELATNQSTDPTIFFSEKKDILCSNNSAIKEFSAESNINLQEKLKAAEIITRKSGNASKNIEKFEEQAFLLNIIEEKLGHLMHKAQQSGRTSIINKTQDQKIISFRNAMQKGIMLVLSEKSNEEKLPGSSQKLAKHFSEKIIYFSDEIIKLEGLAQLQDINKNISENHSKTIQSITIKAKLMKSISHLFLIFCSRISNQYQNVLSRFSINKWILSCVPLFVKEIIENKIELFIKLDKRLPDLFFANKELLTHILNFFLHFFTTKGVSTINLEFKLIENMLEFSICDLANTLPIDSVNLNIKEHSTIINSFLSRVCDMSFLEIIENLVQMLNGGKDIQIQIHEGNIKFNWLVCEMQETAEVENLRDDENVVPINFSFTCYDEQENFKFLKIKFH